MKSVKNIKLELWTKNDTIVTPVQLDGGIRAISADIFSAGVPFVIPSGSATYLAVQKPDGTTTLSNCEYTGNRVTATIPSQALTVKGFANAAIRIVTGNGSITTPYFKIKIEEQCVTDGEIISSSEFSALVDALQKTQSIPTDVTIKNRILQLASNGNNIGSGAALPIDNMELWNDITLTEDVRSVMRSTDDNGIAYGNIKKFFLIYIGDITPGTFPLLLRSNGGEIYQMYQTMTFPEKNSTQAFFWVKCEKIADGLIKSEYPNMFLSTGISNTPGNISYIQGLTGTKGQVCSNLYLSTTKKDTSAQKDWYFEIRKEGFFLLNGGRILVWGIREDD